MNNERSFCDQKKFIQVLTTVILISLIGLYPNQLSAQIIMNGSLTGHVYSIIDSMPGTDGNDYSNPSPAEFVEWTNLIDALLGENYTSATSLANELNYDLIDFTDGTDKYYILQKQATSSNYWGTYVYNPNWCRKVVIQSPHPKKDFNTGKQGVYVLKNTDAMFYCLSGSHRCNNDSLSSCSGTTSVCDPDGQPFRISDVAHNDNSIFQATTEAIKAFDSTITFIQLHGFNKLPTDPYMIMSNGTQITPSPDYINLLKNELFIIDNVLDFKIAHQDLTWVRLRGFNNVQGRLINSSENACNTNADSTLGTFIHIEQEQNRLRSDSTKWGKMAQAINNAFDCQPTSVHGTQVNVSFELYPNPSHQYVILEFNNPTQENFTLVFYNIHGQLVATIKNITTNRIEIERKNLALGVYFLQLQSDQKVCATGKLIIE